MKPYPLVGELLAPVLRVAMTRDPRLDSRDPRGTTQRAVGSPAFLARCFPARGRGRTVSVPPQFKHLETERCPLPFHDIARLMPYRLQLKAHDELLEWLALVAAKQEKQ
jgi:hypothetical protein